MDTSGIDCSNTSLHPPLCCYMYRTQNLYDSTVSSFVNVNCMFRWLGHLPQEPAAKSFIATTAHARLFVSSTRTSLTPPGRTTGLSHAWNWRTLTSSAEFSFQAPLGTAKFGAPTDFIIRSACSKSTYSLRFLYRVTSYRDAIKILEFRSIFVCYYF